jgi:hypothetical protein
MMAVLRVVNLSLAALSVVASSLFAQSDPMAKWMPNVGDKFVYDRHSWYLVSHLGAHQDTTFVNDTLTIEIVRTDSILVSDASWHVVVAKDSSSNSRIPNQQSFYFHVDPVSNSIHPLKINDRPPDPSSSFFFFPYDFSNCSDSQATFGVRQITALRFDSSTETHGAPVDMCRRTAVYSPEVRWFLYLSEYDFSNFTLSTSQESNSTLALIFSSLLSVDAPLNNIELFSVSSNGVSINVLLRIILQNNPVLTLLDPLGRPIRSWQMPVEAGERRITLNVADVPSGVYFLRVSDGRVDEVKRVCITH